MDKASCLTLRLPTTFLFRGERFGNLPRRSLGRTHRLPAPALDNGLRLGEQQVGDGSTVLISAWGKPRAEPKEPGAAGGELFEIHESRFCDPHLQKIAGCSERRFCHFRLFHKFVDVARSTTFPPNFPSPRRESENSLPRKAWFHFKNSSEQGPCSVAPRVETPPDPTTPAQPTHKLSPSRPRSAPDRYHSPSPTSHSLGLTLLRPTPPPLSHSTSELTSPPSSLRPDRCPAAPQRRRSAAPAAPRPGAARTHHAQHGEAVD